MSQTILLNSNSNTRRLKTNHEDSETKSDMKEPNHINDISLEKKLLIFYFEDAFCLTSYP